LADRLFEAREQLAAANARAENAEAQARTLREASERIKAVSLEMWQIANTALATAPPDSTDKEDA
jgi:methionine synthase II (cobalamin-independent)